MVLSTGMFLVLLQVLRLQETCLALELLSSRRRHLLRITLSSLVTASLRIPFPVIAAETVGKDPLCNDPSCLGVWDGLLADCPHFTGNFGVGSAGCVSSQDDTPSVFAEPWDYSESSNANDQPGVILDQLIVALSAIATKRGEAVEILRRDGRYLRALFVNARTKEESVGEFYLTPNDTTVQFRINSQRSAKSSGLTQPLVVGQSINNRERSELIRKELRFLKLPVLRNRQRSLFFVESDYDSFGPGSAALGPPAELSTGELEGRQDVDPRIKIDLLEQFPRPP